MAELRKPSQRDITPGPASLGLSVVLGLGVVLNLGLSVVLNRHKWHPVN